MTRIDRICQENGWPKFPETWVRFLVSKSLPWMAGDIVASIIPGAVWDGEFSVLIKDNGNFVDIVHIGMLRDRAAIHFVEED